MNNLRKGATALLASAALTVGGVSFATAASADDASGSSDPCATQQAHLDKAQAKLDWLTQKFAAQAAKVRKDRRAVAATKGSAKAQAEKALHAAKAKKERIAKAKKAQQKRVAHDTAMLQKCQAANA